ncbi:glycosyltransferase [Lentzea sp. NBRC 105346]|uniref:glycosyltransferase n=1 Tax=Lentzea sp. NBRC 105346 TaxID=3032205 RepID=UPI00332252CB
MLSTIGTRGDVEPVLGLATALRKLGQEVRVCAPPDFRDWVEGFGVPFTPVGPEVRRPAAAQAKPTPEQLRQSVADTVAAQFGTITDVAADCDVLVGAGALQIALRSIAESQGKPYVFAAYCPITLPSRHHAPPALPGRTATGDNLTRWHEDAGFWNQLWGPHLNEHRSVAGLAPVENVRDHVFTDRPWLATDPLLGPWPGEEDVLQTGAWIRPDDRPLSRELEAFLSAGEPPIYFGLGSSQGVGPNLDEVMIETARALGRRAILHRGWADLSLVDDAPDLISIGEVNQQALFPRVAAVVHHGGAGTTHTTTRAGVPQVVLPQSYDQYYWGQRVTALEVGAIGSESLLDALKRVLEPEVAEQARAVAGWTRADGAEVAARHLVALA